MSTVDGKQATRRPGLNDVITSGYAISTPEGQSLVSAVKSLQEAHSTTAGAL
uniref:Uncharacterized protein n=1 Tax=Klebsiella pneumoniae TaxID=573 RepID=A0A6G6AQ61_KLEPN|nr:hypothetical protein [Klebsiella pneumoniae]UFD97168.1 hypothetical protein [Klebsiella pneumoniae]